MTRANRSSKSPPADSEGISNLVGSRKSILALRKADSISSSMMTGSKAGNDGEEGASDGPIIRFPKCKMSIRCPQIQCDQPASSSISQGVAIVACVQPDLYSGVHGGRQEYRILFVQGCFLLSISRFVPGPVLYDHGSWDK